MIDLARAKAREAGVNNVDFEVASVDDLRAASNSFDVVLAHSILHLVPDADRALSKLHEILKPGGLLISSTPCMRDFMLLFRYIGPVGRRLGIMPCVNVFSEAELDRWLSDTGFACKERWKPHPKRGIYLVALKPDESVIES